MRYLKKLNLMLLLILIFSCAVLANRAEKEFYLEKLNEHIPDGYYLVERKFVDFENGDKYALLGVENWASGAEARLKLMVFKLLEDDVQKIWESDEFKGRITDLCVMYIRNKDKKDIVLITVDLEKKPYISTVWIYTWERENIYMSYPEDKENNLLKSEQMILEPFDSQKDGIYGFKTVKYVENGRINKYYRYHNGELEFIKEVFEENKPELNTQEKKEPSPEEIYPEICEFVYNRYPKIKLLHNILELESKLYMVATDIGKIILEKKGEEIKEWYIIDEEPYSYLICEDSFDNGRDLNKDGYVELILEDWDMTETYYYILSLKPEGYELITEVDEDGRSLVWTDSFLSYLRIRRNGDEIYMRSRVWYEGKRCIQEWIWEERLRKFIKYQIKIWDDETNSERVLEKQYHGE